MAGTSSRGANRAAPDILVPSVVAPGVDILAAYGTDDDIEYGVISGTSMARATRKWTGDDEFRTQLDVLDQVMAKVEVPG